MKESIVVTGGAGYIGSHMVRMLLDDGFRVCVIDNLFRGNRDAVPSDVEFQLADVCEKRELEQAIRPGGHSAVMHFAGLAYVGESVERPGDYWRNNVVGSWNLLEVMRSAGIGRIVFSSTCSTYGIPDSDRITEEHPQIPINPYGRTKLTVERMLQDSVTEGLLSVALRYFNVAGSDPDGRLGERHEPETHLIPLILREAERVLRGEDPERTELRVFGNDFPTPDGTCIRDYVHVTDLCRAHLAALRRLLDGSVEGFEAFNIGNGKGFSVREVIDACRRVTGADIRHRVANRRPGDPPRLVACSDRARQMLGWRPEHVELDDIVATAWRWMRAR